jgi:predicted small integral membrane protein
VRKAVYRSANAEDIRDVEAQMSNGIDTRMAARWSKILLLAAIGFYFALVVLNNVTDFGVNYQFVRHTLSMDTIPPGNHLLWRAIHRPAVWISFYVAIIAWEAVSVVLCAWGSLALWRARRGTAQAFLHAKQVGIAALTVGMLQWFVAFVCVGGEWFLMWQSTWNGIEAAFRLFMVEAVVLVLLMMPELAPGE